MQSVRYWFERRNEKMRRHLIGDEYFFHIARQIKSLRYVCANTCRIWVLYGLAAVHPYFHLAPVRFAMTAVIAPPKPSLNVHLPAFMSRQFLCFLACRSQRNRLTRFACRPYSAQIRPENKQRGNCGRTSIGGPSLTYIRQHTPQANPVLLVCMIHMQLRLRYRLPPLLLPHPL